MWMKVSRDTGINQLNAFGGYFLMLEQIDDFIITFVLSGDTDEDHHVTAHSAFVSYFADAKHQN